MNETTTIARDVVNQLKGLSPELLMGLGLILMGYVLRYLPWIKNRFIPPICMLGGAAIYPFIARPGDAPPELSNPQVHMVLLGFVIGCAAWIFHNKVLSKWLDPLLPVPVEDRPEPKQEVVEPPKDHPGIDFSKMKIALVSIGLSLLVGCATTSTPPRTNQERALSTIENVVSLVATIRIADKPAERPKLQAIYDRLIAADAGAINLSDLSQAVVYIKGNDAAIYVAIIGLALNELEKEGLSVQTPEQLKLVIKALKNGLGRALATG